MTLFAVICCFDSEGTNGLKLEKHLPSVFKFCSVVFCSVLFCSVMENAPPEKFHVTFSS